MNTSSHLTDKGFELEGQKEIRTMTSDYPHYYTSGMFFNTADDAADDAADAKK
jgi:hypothetical protein